MNKSILEALMKLFAIIADVGNKEISGEARGIVASYLKRQFSREYVNKYLALFESFLKKYHKEEQRDKKYRVSVSNSVRVLHICKQINEELEQHQKILTLIELFEFARENYKLSERELAFIETVAVTFRISQEELENIETFVNSEKKGLKENKQFLLIDNNASYPYSLIKHIFQAAIKGKIIFLHIQSTNTFVFRYIGKGNIYLNGHNIKINRSYVLAVGSVIKGKKIEPIYYGNIANRFIQASIKSKIYYIAKDVEYKFKDGVKGLHAFSFTETSGSLVGIMGGSGVGKSTLLNVLNGTLPLSKGSISINGINLNENKEQLEGVIGYIPQDDLLIEELTVYRNLYYNAKLCFRSYNEEQLNNAVEQALIDFDLVEAENLKVGTPLNKIISGGQRKRLNIALELIREPSVLFVDEPTSGLSSVDAEKVMFLLKRQTLKGKLVIVNIHQPSSDIYKQLDRLLIMDKGGRVIYNGNPIDANVYFKTMSNHVNANERECQLCGNVNTEEPLRIVEARIVNEYGKLTRIRKVKSEEWLELYRKEIEPRKLDVIKEREAKAKNEPLPQNNFKIPNRTKQFAVYLIRNLKAKISNSQYIIINLFEAPLLAGVLGYFTKYTVGSEYVFYENKNFPVFLFMSVLVAIFMGLTVSADEIIKDKKILKREAFLNLSRFSYLGAKTLFLFTVSAIQTFLYLIVGHLIIGFDDMFFIYWFALFTTSCLSNMIGLNISAGLNSVVNIYILIPFILVPQILLSGVMINFRDINKNFTSGINVPFSGDLMPSRWAYEAIAVQQFKQNEYSKYFFKYQQKIKNASFVFAFIIPELNRILEAKRRGKTEKYDSEILKNELIKLSEESKKTIPFDVNTLKNKNIDEETYQLCKQYLNNIRAYFLQIKKEQSKLKDIAYLDLEKKYGKEKLVEMKLNGENKALNNYMLNKMELTAIEKTKSRLLRKKDMVYMLPTSKIGRAHYYSTVKIIGKTKIPTYTFNMIIMWLYALLLFILLYFDILKRGLAYIERKTSSLLKKKK